MCITLRIFFLSVLFVNILSQEISQEELDKVFGKPPTPIRPNTQNVDSQSVDDIFGPRPDVSSTTVPGAPVYIYGDGTSNNDCICVPYYNCDANGVLKLDGETDGFGVIDIRFGKNKCPHYLDVCCTYPEDTPPIIPSPETPIDDRPTSVSPPVSVTPPVIPQTPPPTIPPTQKMRCGKRNPFGVEFNITGNNDREAQYGEFPWMVALLKNNYIAGSDDNLAICGGSLINLQVVLTGAHCVENLHETDIRVRAGEWDTQTTKERYPYQERNVKQIVIQSDYQKGTLYNDIALLVLDSPLKYSANVKPVCLPEQGYVFNHNECFASGWGKTIFGKEGSPAVILKKIDLPIVPHNKCEKSLQGTRLGKYFTLHPSFICAGGIPGKDTCTGDGGSPLVCPDPNSPGRYAQAGIVAWGIGCGDKVPGVYANVAKFRKWIDTQMEYLGFDSSSYTE